MGRDWCFQVDLENWTSNPNNNTDLLQLDTVDYQHTAFAI